MARTIIEVLTVEAPSGLTDKALGNKMTSAIKGRLLKRKKAKETGILKSTQFHYIPGKNPRYKVILTILSFDASE